MTATQHTLAVLFPGAEKRDISIASEKYHIQVEGQEVYSMQKDYERYFKPSRSIFHKDDINLLFVFADGSAQLVEDEKSLKSVLNKAKELLGL